MCLLVKHNVHFYSSTARSDIFYSNLLMMHYLNIKENTYSSWLGHGKHINHSHCVVINELSQHQSHDLHWHTSTPMLQHLMNERSQRCYLKYKNEYENFDRKCSVQIIRDHLEQGQRGDVDLLCCIHSRCICGGALRSQSRVYLLPVQAYLIQ